MGFLYDIRECPKCECAAMEAGYVKPLLASDCWVCTICDDRCLEEVRENVTVVSTVGHVRSTGNIGREDTISFGGTIKHYRCGGCGAVVFTPTSDRGLFAFLQQGGGEAGFVNRHRCANCGYVTQQEGENNEVSI